ncbi:MAG: DUF11 domain-containing protein [Myxococcaceae bacterium]|nr:DUF11 domain-containing protein [Myxococcaceae bacterium]
MRWAVLIAVGAALAGCNADVVLGRNFPADASSADAGDDGGTGMLDGGGGSDGGADAGSQDGGLDAGVDGGSDGGADAGADAGLDAGTDAGLDGGAGDAGADAGADAGVDAGPANLTLELTGPLVVQAADPGTYTATLTNSGGQPSLPQNVVITFPAGLTFVSSAGCASSAVNAVSCDLGVIPAQSAVSGSATMTVMAPDSGLGWHEVSAAAGPLDASTPLAVTSIGTVVVTVGAPRMVQVDACFGTGTYSYSQCTPASLVSAAVLFLPDGGIDSIDAGYYGQWGQSSHLRNLGFRFWAPGNINGTRFAGQSVNATCFQGVVDNPMGVHNVGAFQACLQ